MDRAAIFYEGIEADIEAVSKIPVVGSILEVVCRSTGMGFAAIARVTDEKWVACSVRDEIQFGLLPGGELQLETTICHEIRQSGKAVVIDHVEEDEVFARHHTPAMYGFQSYISVPIILKDGSFFGTLCAIDPKPHTLNNEQTIGMFLLFADLISFHLHTFQQLAATEAKLSEEKQIAEIAEVSLRQEHALNGALIATNDLLAEVQKNLQHANSALKASKNNLEQILKRLPTPVTVLEGPDQVISVTNDAILTFWGRQREDVIGRPMLEVFPELGDQPFSAQWREVMATGESITNHERPVFLMGPGGEKRQFYIDNYYQPMFGLSGDITGILATIIDVTDKVNARRAVEKAEAKLRLAIDFTRLGTWFIDAQTREFIPSDRLKELFGYHADEEMTFEAATVQITEVYRPKFIAAVESAIMNGIDYEIEYPIIGFHDQKLRWVKATGKLNQYDDGQPAYFSGTVLDITESKLDDLRKNDFTGMVSHELKTPLTSLNAYTQMLHARAVKGGDTFTMGALEKVKSQVKKMSTMINGFLNVSRLESGKIHLEKTTFDLSGLVAEIMEETGLTVPAHQIVFVPGETVFVNADRDKIGSVLSNLLSNAIKYSPKGKNIKVEYQITPRGVQVSVKDEGMGIKPDDVAHLFERYFRVENKHTQNISGFGIGLYLSAEIIRRHNGEIWVESQSGIGSTFYFSLPL